LDVLLNGKNQSREGEEDVDLYAAAHKNHVFLLLLFLYQEDPYS
jgi:hypothetical protein